MSFNTGDNLPIDRGVLENSADYLVRNNLAHHMRAIGDGHATYAQLMKSADGHPAFYLVARRSEPYKVEGVGYISSQRSLIIRAAEDGYPILVAMWPQGASRPSWRIFDPREIKRLHAEDLLNKRSQNKRLGSVMVNYEWNLGVDLSPYRILQVWGELQRNMEAREKRRLVQSQFKPASTLEMGPPRIVNCSRCGCRFSSKMGSCPSCRGI